MAVKRGRDRLLQTLASFLLRVFFPLCFKFHYILLPFLGKYARTYFGRRNGRTGNTPCTSTFSNKHRRFKVGEGQEQEVDKGTVAYTALGWPYLLGWMDER